MTRNLRLLLTTTALLATALFVACSSSSDDNGDNGDGDNGPEATDPVDDGDGDGDGDGDASSQLADFASQFGATEVRIVYSYTSETNGTVDDQGTMTLYWRPDDGWRFDLTSNGDETTMISRGETSYICTGGADAQCIESSIAGQIPIPFLSIFTDPAAFQSQIGDITGNANVDVDSSSRNIAGIDGTCFTYSGTVDGESGEAEYCFSDNGIMLSLVGGGDDGQGGTSTFSLTATDVSTTVSATDLDPPYPILNLDDLIP